MKEALKDIFNIIIEIVTIIKLFVNSQKFTDYILFILLLTGLYFAYFLGTKIITNNYSTNIITAFVILLSSFIASFSMLKSIKHSDKQKSFDRVNILSSNIEKYTKEIIDTCKDYYKIKNINSDEYEIVLINLDYSVSRLVFLMSEYYEVARDLENHLFDDFSTIIKMRLENFIEGTLKLEIVVHDISGKYSDVTIESEEKIIINNLIRHRNLIYKRYENIINI